MCSTVMFIHCVGIICNYILYTGWTLQGQLYNLTPSITAPENKCFSWYIKVRKFSAQLTCSECLKTVLHSASFRWVWLGIVINPLLNCSQQYFSKSSQCQYLNLVRAATSESQGTCTNFAARCISVSASGFGPLLTCK